MAYDVVKGAIKGSTTASSTTGSATGSATGTGAGADLFFFFVGLPPAAAAAPPPAPRQHNNNAKRSNHCQICKYEPEEPDALDPEESPDECPGNEDPLTLEPLLSEPEDDNKESKLLPDESDEP